MHRGHDVAGPPATGAWDPIRASTWGLRWTWFILVGDCDKASDGGSPFVEFPRNGRKVEEQLRAPGLLLGLAVAKTARTATRFDS